MNAATSNVELDSLDEQAHIVHLLVGGLLSGGAADDRFRVFDALCFHAVQAYAQDITPAFYLDNFDDPEFRERLLANPAAVPLLAYVLIALAKFNDINGGKAEASTSQRRADLSEAFYVAGKQGESWLPIDQRMSLNMQFNSAMDEALALSATTSTSEASRTTTAKNAALRATYIYRYKHAYDSDNETHKGRMKGIRAVLREMGSGDRLGKKK